MLEHIDAFFNRFIKLSIKALFLLFIVLALLCSVSIKVLDPVALRYYPLFGTHSFLVRSFPRKIPYLITDLPFPAISAKSVFAIDIKNNKELLNINAYKHFAPASTTKLMTALVALDLYDMASYIEVPEVCTQVEGSKLGLLPGEQLRVTDLFYSLLVSSANDAACVFAHGSVTPHEFVQLMNKKALSLGLSNTRFTNVSGLDGVEGAHFSSAYDLYVLATKSMESDFVREIVKTKEFDIMSGAFPRHIYTTNHLLREIPGSVGIKTGTTVEAGEVLIYEYQAAEKDLVIVVMGSVDRFLDTRLLLDWILASYSWE